MTSTREALIEARRRNPCCTLKELAALVAPSVGHKVSRERIRQLLSSESLPTIGIQQYECANCLRPFPVLRNQAPNRHARYCSPECRRAHMMVDSVCDQCGRTSKRRESDVMNWARHPSKCTLAKAEHIFCSKPCQGRWLASHHGFATWSPEKRAKAVQKAKRTRLAKKQCHVS